MDTTLRDGEQTQGVSYSPLEKLHVAKLLLKDLKVDRIEVSSARVSLGEFEAIKQITDWARHNNLHGKVEVLGFVDGDISLNWINDAGGKVINLLCKGSLRHLEKQLKKTPERHVSEIKEILRKAEDRDMEVNLYLEDWSNGMIHSEEYVFFFIDSLKDENIKRFMLPDTLGILNPEQTFNFCKKIVDSPTSRARRKESRSSSLRLGNQRNLLISLVLSGTTARSIIVALERSMLETILAVCC